MVALAGSWALDAELFLFAPGLVASVVAFSRLGLAWRNIFRPCPADFALQVLAPLAPLAAALAAEVVELVAVSLLLPHAVRVTAAAAATTAAASRFVIFVLPACMTTPLLLFGPGRRTDQNQSESGAAMYTARLVLQLMLGPRSAYGTQTTIPLRHSDRTPAACGAVVLCCPNEKRQFGQLDRTILLTRWLTAPTERNGLRHRCLALPNWTTLINNWSLERLNLLLHRCFFRTAQRYPAN